MKVTKVYDANIFVNNTSTHGQASEVTPPTLTAVMADYKAMGMAGSLELFNGFDKMETTIKWIYPDSDTQKVFANFRKPIDLMIRSSKAECETGEIVEVPIVMYVKGYSKTHPAGTFKAGDTVQHKTFGTGVILTATPMANDTLLEIAFDKVGTKKLFANFARLTKG